MRCSGVVCGTTSTRLGDGEVAAAECSGMQHGGFLIPAKQLCMPLCRYIQQDVCVWGAALGTPAHHIGFRGDQVTLQVPCTPAAYPFTPTPRRAGNMQEWHR